MIRTRNVDLLCFFCALTSAKGSGGGESDLFFSGGFGTCAKFMVGSADAASVNLARIWSTGRYSTAS